MATQIKKPLPACAKIIEEITKIYKSLPTRPSIVEVEAANSVLKSVETEEEIKLEEISKKVEPQDVPIELYSVLQQVRKSIVLFQSQEQKKESIQLIELEKTYQNFDELIQKASELVSVEDSIGEIEEKVVFSDEKSDSLKGFVAISENTGVSSSGLDIFPFIVCPRF